MIDMPTVKQAVTIFELSADNIYHILCLLDCRHINHMTSETKCSFALFLMLIECSHKFCCPFYPLLTWCVRGLNNIYLSRMNNLFTSKSPSCALVTLYFQPLLIFVIYVDTIYGLKSMRLSSSYNNLPRQ